MKKRLPKGSLFSLEHFKIVFKEFKVEYFLDIIEAFLGHNSDIKHTLSISVFVR